MRRLIALALLLFAPIVVEGCGSDSITDPRDSIAGSFTLSSFDGASLPVTLIAGDPQLEVVSDELIFSSGGTFTQNTLFRFTEGGVPSVEAQSELGTFTLSGSTVTFRFSNDNSTASATVSGDRLTVTSEGHTLVYLRP